jgi:hypothetical protein
MRTSYPRRSRAYLDQVIDGRASGPDPLIGLIQQIQAPPRRRETLGLRAAASTFAWAPSVRPYLPPHHRTGLSSTSARLWHPKVLAAGLSLMVATAIGLAYTGDLSTHRSTTGLTVGGIAAELSAQASASASPTRPPSNRRRTTPVAPAEAPAGATGSSAAPSATPSPALLVRLCQQWLARPTDSTVDDNSIFSLLIRAAGGLDALDTYCSTLVNSGAPPASLGATLGTTPPPVHGNGFTQDPAPTPTS